MELNCSVDYLVTMRYYDNLQVLLFGSGLKCWWTNKNLIRYILINSFYLQAAKMLKDATCGAWMSVLCLELQQNDIFRVFKVISS